MACRIRFFREGDQASLRNLLQRYNQKVPTDLVRKAIEAEEEATHWAIERNGKLIGYVGFNKKGSDYHVAIFADPSITEDCSRRVLGAALHRFHRMRHPPRVLVSVPVTNLRTSAFFRSVGFVTSSKKNPGVIVLEHSLGDVSMVSLPGRTRSERKQKRSEGQKRSKRGKRKRAFSR